jgi:hypothetical protein
MKNAGWMVLCIFGSLLPTAVFADDASASDADAPRLPVATSTPETHPLDSLYSSRWKLSPPVETIAYSNEASAPIASFVFQDPGAFARVSKVRELSLLTLAEVGSTRVFLGVSDEGLLGIHLGVLPRLGDGRCLELVRMPYLKSFRSDDTTE